MLSLRMLHICGIKSSSACAILCVARGASWLNLFVSLAEFGSNYLYIPLKFRLAARPLTIPLIKPTIQLCLWRPLLIYKYALNLFPSLVDNISPACLSKLLKQQRLLNAFKSSKIRFSLVLIIKKRRTNKDVTFFYGHITNVSINDFWIKCGQVKLILRKQLTTQFLFPSNANADFTFTLIRKALCVCAHLISMSTATELECGGSARIRVRKTLLWKSNENLKFKQMSKCTTESNVDEILGTFHFISRHELRLTATKVAECSLLSPSITRKYNNCTIAARILFIQKKNIEKPSVELLHNWNITESPQSRHPFWRFRYQGYSHITWDWIYILFVLLLFGILCVVFALAHTHIRVIRAIMYLSVQFSSV